MISSAALLNLALELASAGLSAAQAAAVDNLEDAEEALNRARVKFDEAYAGLQDAIAQRETDA